MGIKLGTTAIQFVNVLTGNRFRFVGGEEDHLKVTFDNSGVPAAVNLITSKVIGVSPDAEVYEFGNERVPLAALELGDTFIMADQPHIIIDINGDTYVLGLEDLCLSEQASFHERTMVDKRDLTVTW